MPYATINKPTDYFNTKLYTGNGTAIGSGGNAITGVGFQPDWTWIKDRTSVNNNNVFDVIRGVTKGLQTSSQIAEYTNTETLSTFDTDGFTVGNAGGLNTNSNNYVSWNWLASNTTASNTDGTITSTVSANTTSGFSIVSYTGNGSASATVGHGLNGVPELIIGKNRNATNRNWMTKHKDLTAGNYTLALNQSLAQFSPGDATYDLGDSSTFGFTTASNADNVNLNTNTFIAFCFKSVKGFSKIGYYTGNGNADGAFIYTGFKPAFVLTKASSSTGQWIIHDTARDPFNQANRVLYPSLSNAEENNISDQIDILSNGFKIKATGSAINGSGVTYIYMAIAEQPLVGTNNIPATAR